MKRILGCLIIGILLFSVLHFTVPVSTGQENVPTYYVPVYVNIAVTTIKDIILTPNGFIGDPANETNWDSTIYGTLFPEYIAAIQAYDAAYIRNSQNEKIGFRLPDHTTENGSILNVTVYGLLQITGVMGKCRIYLSNETIDDGHESIEFTPGNVWTYYAEAFTQYKDTDEIRPWTWADIDTLEVQIAKTYGYTSNVLFCNHLYVQVFYVEDTGETLPILTLIPVQEAITNIITYVVGTNLPNKVKKEISNKLDDASKLFDENKFHRAMRTLTDLIKELQKMKVASRYADIINKIVKDIRYIVNNIQIQ
jgi:hypothetical protein